MSQLKVFISSVRRGLEQERDALKGLLVALGHEPLRFEDFTAQPIPSRQACLDGVLAADAYLLLLGAHYGDVFPETGLSATAEEHVAALTKGIPRLAFVKKGVSMDPKQDGFRQEVERYATGLFRASFTDAVDLLPAVAAALREASSAGRPLIWSPLRDALAIEWRTSWSSPRQHTDGAIVELHAVPVIDRTLSARELRQLGDELVGRLRTLGAVVSSAAIDAGADAFAAWALPSSDERRGSWNDARPEALLGARIARNGQRSTWMRLPADGLGALLDDADLSDRLARLLRLLGGLAPLDSDGYAVAVGLASASMVSIGPVSKLGARSSAQIASLNQSDVLVPPDEAVSAAGLVDGAGEVAAALSKSLLAAFPRW